MRQSSFRVIAGALGLAALAAGPLPIARAHHVPAGPDYQATEKDFAVEHFSAKSIDVNHTFLPVPPGTTFTLSGAPGRKLVFTATELTKMVNGVRTQVLWSRDYEAGALVEELLAFWAQDDFGNVWQFGEYPEEIAGKGKIYAPSSWLAGNQGSNAGILMRANPQPNTSTYKQGEAPSVELLDNARVQAVNERRCVPTGCYDGVLVIDEWDPNNQPQDGHLFKSHAPGAGIVHMSARGGDEPETLESTERRLLTPEELAAANARAFELDRRAYTLAKPVYGLTEPAVLRCGTPPAGSLVCPPAVPTPPTEVPPAKPPVGARPERSRATGQGRVR